MEWKWTRKDNACTGCGICLDVCQEEAILMTREMGLPEALPGACTGCRECERECPFEAITVTICQNDKL
ncbi:MAG: 4Fe-4S dicluster domain-containing protein [Acidobacteria bacterium]|nr:4Fe-4S dicluster domain-containing protein [Acidobacteriota bacterium]